MSQNDTLTTGEAAKYCGVNFRTVIRWIERGRLQAYKLPGRGDHRIPVTEFVRFLQENRMPVPTDLAPVQPRRVLVVEDQPEMANAITRVLKRAGYEVTQAHDGFSAGLLAGSLRPALVTLDLKMPGINGFEVLHQLRAQVELAATKVLVISAEQPENLDKAVDEGADAALPKPFDNQELLDAVARLLA